MCGKDAAPGRPVVALAVLAVLVVITAATLLLLAAAVTAIAPRTSLLGPAASPNLVGVYGPPLVVLGVVVTAGAWLLRRRRRVRAATTAVAAAAALATLVLAGAVGAMVVATVGAGGSIDPWRAVTLAGPPADTGPDDHPVYATGPDGRPLHLAIYRPRATTATVGAPAPVLVWVHGGGWTTGSELDRAADLRRVADAGWLAVSVEYTPARPGLPTWDVAGPEVACALARAAEDAGGYGADASRIVLGGDSAGGQLAVTVGQRAAAGTQASACASPVPRPRGIATIYPAVDLADTYAHGLGAQRAAVGYTGATPGQRPERYRAVAGTDSVRPGGPPVLVLAPTRDGLVPPGGTSRYVDAARAAGVAVDRVAIPFADHAFDIGPDGSLGHQAASSVVAHWAGEQVGPISR